MGITVHPADGLIHRLLQQNERSVSNTRPKPQADSNAPRNDVHVRISQQARQLGLDDASTASKRDLENHLLEMYRANGRVVRKG